MDQAKEYLKQSNGVQTVVITSLLDEFEDEIKKMKGKIMDIGCGPGNHTRNLLLPKFPKDTIVVGMDVSKNMIDCARTINTGEKRLTFELMNIETNDLPQENIERFDNGFSFFCLQWVQDMKRGFGNIYKMLRPGGTFISSQILSFGVYPAYLRLYQDPRYKEYMKDVFKVINPLYFDKTPRATFKKILQEIGFEVIHCSLRENVSGYDVPEDRRELFQSINQFVIRMPKSMQEEYIDNILKESLKEKSVLFRPSENPKEKDEVFDVYNLLMLHLRKPLR
ncbi:juvenile hormone acid O-methyltransferase-like [Leptopilina boulardi]|uniref:juvenile hormone acid O-methyltransferase-like n=1 Tax=Leptopilina boulardi TaxID=63433 RepID=UPI0021F5DD0D|nr:juvenile hormone acid O-methyltransferase-like [Leptopilina boulardi]XP_051161278.1 juvenile hormone acid O-methyltransferase-like [Leptopilina boulardi]XP_051161279.1 juvenile hormone acid O-methyltransferase-like [Leptopilina boulardi]XP_051161280.1 juvenile hormone acid O-methyltransferase-like [Leptopilina boulardi]